MKPSIVFFDCAQTLIRVRWKVGEFAVETAEHLGLHFNLGAADRYLALFRSRLALYHEVNLTKSKETVRKFWTNLNRDWLAQEQSKPESAEEMVEVSDQRLFSKSSPVFQPFSDVIPCLQRLKEQGIPMGVISNWDISLHRVLETFNLTPYFKVVIASLEEGVEKPDSRVFHIALKRAGVDAQSAIHVGDDAFDDLQGARQAGLKGVLIDRARASTIAPFLATLDDLEKSFSWPSLASAQ